MEKDDDFKVTVFVDLGFTKNTGDFNNIKYNVGLQIEGKKGSEDELYEYANNWVGKKVNEFKGN